MITANGYCERSFVDLSGLRCKNLGTEFDTTNPNGIPL